MQFRRSGPSDQRRRRVLLEENRTQAARAAAPSSARGTAGRVQRSYSEAALDDRQPPLTSLIPRRRLTLLSLLLALLAAIAGLLAAYGQLRLRSADFWPSPLEALDVERPGSLTAWFSSLVLLLAAALGVQIYRLRRHRVDDYRGRYRVWIWTPAVLAVMAAGAATPIVADGTAVIVHYSGLQAGPAVTYLQTVTLAAIWTLVGLRLAFEMRRSPAAILFLILSVACYFGFAVIRVQTVPPMAELLRTLAATGVLLLGHVAVLFAIVIYGRHVYRDSQGLITAGARNRAKKAARPARRQKEEPAEEAAATAEDDDEADEAESQTTGAPAKPAAEPKPEKKLDAPRPAAALAPTRPAPAAPPAPSPKPTPNLSPHPSAKPKGAPPPSPPTPADDDEEEDDADILSGQFGDEDQGLSRAERRRLRKLQRRDLRRAA